MAPAEACRSSDYHETGQALELWVGFVSSVVKR